MFRGCFTAKVREAAKRSVAAERRERWRQEDARLAEAEQEHKKYQASLLAQIETLQEELKAFGGENANLAREIEELRASLTAAQKLAEEMEKQVQHVQTLHEAKRQQEEKATQEQTVRCQETAEMRKGYETLKQRLVELETHSRETADLQKRYEALKESHENLNLIQEKLKDQRKAETDTRTQETDEQRTRYEILKANYENVRKMNERLEEKLIENENFLRTQEGQIAARFEKQLAEARCECAQARADCDDYEASLAACQKQLQTAREQNTKLRAYLEEDTDKENQNTSNVKVGFISNALGQARRTLQGHYK